MTRVASDARTDVRLPGVYFLPPPRPAPAGLPPLDVAGFVGFAARGPVHTPVRIDDAATYADVFGGDLAVAREAGGRVVRANLPAAVADFFANGGRRCYVVRVANTDPADPNAAAPARFRLPGVAALSAGGVALAASVPASSPGRWAGDVRLGTRLAAAPLSAADVTSLDAGDAPVTRLRWPVAGGGNSIQTGDVLRLTFETGDTWLAPVAAATPERPANGGVHLDVPAAYRLLRPADPDAPGGLPTTGKAWRLGIDGPAAKPADAAVEAGTTTSEFTLRLTGDGAAAVAAGDLLRLDAGGAAYLLSAATVQPAGTEKAGRFVVVTATELLAEAPHPLPPPSGLRRAARVRLDLLVRYATGLQRPVADLGLNADHARFFGAAAMAESSPRFAPRADARALAGRGTLGPGQEAGGENDPSDTDAVRDPAAVAALAGFVGKLGEADSARTFLPVGLGDVFDPARFAGPDATYPGRDGLDVFDPRLMFDPDLLRSAATSATLIDAAFAKRHGGDAPVPLQGLHGLLFEDEVALVSLPDAVHRPWPADVAAAFAAVEPAPPPPAEPDRSVFGDCCPTPPAAAAEPPAPPPPVNAPALPLVAPPGAYGLKELDQLVAAHLNLVQFCQARADAVAVLTLPSHFRAAGCATWQERLRGKLSLPVRPTLSDDTRSVADLSYAAVYHPWLLEADAGEPDGLRAVPPDGAACGTLAARERARGVWVAAANLPLRNVLGLTPPLPAADVPDLFDRRFNLAVREPTRGGDFRFIAAYTLGDGRELFQVSVRRLMILIRKAALRRGAEWVFEVNDRRLAERVRAGLGAMLRGMFERGAFAGATPGQSYRVITDSSVNTPQGVDAGRFVAVIQVAPSQPLEFITVVLVRQPDGGLGLTEA